MPECAQFSTCATKRLFSPPEIKLEGTVRIQRPVCQCINCHSMKSVFLPWFISNRRFSIAIRDPRLRKASLGKTWTRSPL